MNKRLLIPGILGSRLSDGKRDVWCNPLVLGQNLYCLVDNAVTQPQLTPTALLGHVELAGISLQDPYTRWESTGGFPFPYDWRKALKFNARLLSSRIEEISSDGDVIDIVTHSMGGLVLASAIEAKRALMKRIGRIVFVAPPFHGSVVPVSWLSGINSTQSFVKHLLGSRLSSIAASWDGLFDMLFAPKGLWPTTIFGRPVSYPSTASADPYVHQWGPFSSRQMERVEASHRVVQNGLAALIAEKLDDVFVVVGMNGSTPFGLRVAQSYSIDAHRPGQTDLATDGDGTVLTASSVIKGMRLDHFYGVFFADGVDEPHPRMMANETVLRAIEDILSTGGAKNVFVGDDVLDRIHSYARPRTIPASMPSVASRQPLSKSSAPARSSMDLNADSFDYRMHFATDLGAFAPGDRINVRLREVSIGSFPRDFGNQRMGEIAIGVGVTTDNVAGGAPINTEWTLIKAAAEGYLIEVDHGKVVADVVNNVAANQFVHLALELREIDNWETLKAFVATVASPAKAAVRSVPIVGEAAAVAISLVDGNLEALVPDESSQTFFRWAHRFDLAALRKGLLVVTSVHRRHPAGGGNAGVWGSQFTLELW